MNKQKLHIIQNALVGHYLSAIRNKETQIKDFRFALQALSQIIALETVRNFPTKTVNIQTPLEITQCQVLKEQIVIVPVLRAGLSMLSAFLHFLPEAQIGFIGQKRDETTAIASEYYRNFPDLHSKKIIIIDPMLATGGSALSTIDSIIDLGGKVDDIKLSCVIAAPEGVEKIHSNHPELQIFTAALDRQLNEKKYILPGLGDAGDLWTGTN